MCPSQRHIRVLKPRPSERGWFRTGVFAEAVRLASGSPECWRDPVSRILRGEREFARKRGQEY